MTRIRHMFHNLEFKPGGVVVFGGDQKVKIIGSRMIGNDSLLSITNVLLVDGIVHNLLSISQLSDIGYDIIFNQESCKVVSQKDDSILFNGKRKKTFIRLDFLILKSKM